MALYGVDISNWQAVGAGDAGKDFVICKATEGTNYVDPKCDAHYQRAKAQGKLLGVYHFAQPAYNSAEAEADFFVKNIKGYIGEAILVLDYEVAPYSDDWAYAFCKRVHDLTGVWPMLYASASPINSNNWSKTAKNCGLWIAGYPNAYNVPNPPQPNTGDMPYGIGCWPFWAIWQYSSSAGSLDRDIANMDRTAWKKYANPSGSTKPEPTPQPVPAKKTNEQIADEVIAGKWGNGEDRKVRLTNAGYDYNTIQGIVNSKLANNNTKEYYTVRPGDTLSAIALKYNTTVNNLVRLNNIQNPDLIYPNQQIRIR